MEDWMWIVAGVAALVVVAIVLVTTVSRARRRRRSRRLQDRFGPEYETAVQRYGREDGEQHLENLLREHDARRTREVGPAERDAALQSWQSVQTSFVDAPVVAVREADQLVFSVLRERGYPLDTVDARASALSVEAPDLASRYREAHAVRSRAEQAADPQDAGLLRDALLTYRDLLYELVGAPQVTGRLTTRVDDDDRAEPRGRSDEENEQTEEATWTSTRTESRS